MSILKYLTRIMLLRGGLSPYIIFNQGQWMTMYMWSYGIDCDPISTIVDWVFKQLWYIFILTVTRSLLPCNVAVYYFPWLRESPWLNIAQHVDICNLFERDPLHGSMEFYKVNCEDHPLARTTRNLHLQNKKRCPLLDLLWLVIRLKQSNMLYY